MNSSTKSKLHLQNFYYYYACPFQEIAGKQAGGCNRAEAVCFRVNEMPHLPMKKEEQQQWMINEGNMTRLEHKRHACEARDMAPLWEKVQRGENKPPTRGNNTASYKRPTWLVFIRMK